MSPNEDRGSTFLSLQAYFLKDWDSIRDVYFYPPTDGPYAVYTQDELFDSIDTAVQNYDRVTEDPIGERTSPLANTCIAGPVQKIIMVCIPNRT